jgi:hypothetical protein
MQNLFWRFEMKCHSCDKVIIDYNKFTITKVCGLWRVYHSACVESE